MILVIVSDFNNLSIVLFSTLSSLPRSANIAWNSLFLPCFAEPPAESPSTIYNSLYSSDEQSANLPGNASFFIFLPCFANCLAFLAASSISLALSPLRMIVSKIATFLGSLSISVKDFSNTESTASCASAFPSFVLVCPSNSASGTLTEITALRPSVRYLIERLSLTGFLSGPMLSFKIFLSIPNLLSKRR
ncbi:hypothetical protein D3C86_1405280 [compost metagenome]